MKITYNNDNNDYYHSSSNNDNGDINVNYGCDNNNTSSYHGHIVGNLIY